MLPYVRMARLRDDATTSWEGLNDINFFKNALGLESGTMARYRRPIGSYLF